MSFADVVGHEAAVRLLKGQLLHHRLAQSTLFVGLRGIGKKFLAVEFAKALECEKALEDACEACRACQQISRGAFPDVTVVSPEPGTHQIKIDQVRTLAHWSSLTPHTGRWKVGMIEDADRLTEEAAHACLKLLEEPPEQSLLLLTATTLNRLPSTVVSRCHVVRCLPQGIERVTAILQERERLDPILSRMLATWSGGRLGLALEFHRKQRLMEKNRAVDQLLTAWRQKNPEVPLGAASRQEVEEALEWFAAWWRDIVILALGGDPSWLIHQDRVEDLQREAERVRGRRQGAGDGGTLAPCPPPLAPLGELLERIDRTYWAQEAVQRNASPRIALAALLTR